MVCRKPLGTLPLPGWAMTDYAALVTALYAELRTWRATATACDGAFWCPRGSYYRSIAKGAIKRPGAVARRGIVAAYLKYCRNDVTGCYKALERTLRHNVSIKRPLGPAINQWRLERGMTWDQWHEKADALMRHEYASAPDPYDETPLQG